MRQFNQVMFVSSNPPHNLQTEVEKVKKHLQLLPAAVLGSNLAAKWHLAATRYMR